MDNIFTYNPFPIVPHYPYTQASKYLEEHVKKIEKSLKEAMFSGLSFGNKEEFAEWLDTALPYLHWSKISPPDCMSIILVCQPSRVQKTESFFLNLLKKWLIPEKDIDVLSFDYLYFGFEDIPGKTFILAEAKLLVESSQVLQTIKENLPILSQEIAAGINSYQYAQYILETKALSYEHKPTLVHQELIKLRHKKPTYFESDIFAEMSRFLALSDKEFINQRPFRHITRLVSASYLIRKSLKIDLIVSPHKRHLRVHLMRTQLQFPFGMKNILGITMGVHHLHEHEYFDENHILMAVRQLVPKTQLVKGSFYSYQPNHDTIRILYLEVERQDGLKFTLEELSILKRRLSDELMARIQTLTPTIFMVRNEEEFIRNILTLSQELKYISDLPQCVISLHEQTNTHVSFLVILVRILKNDTKSLKELFATLPANIDFLLERNQTVGFLRKKYPKEANVFRLKLAKDASILRTDSSLHFYAARKKIVDVIVKKMGEFRDFNGGIIIKQAEALSRFLEDTSQFPEIKTDLKETFFYSLSPIEMQTVLPTPVMCSLFSLVGKALSHNLHKINDYFYQNIKEDSYVYVCIRLLDTHLKDRLLKLIETDNAFKDCVFSSLTIHGTTIFSMVSPINMGLQREYILGKIEKLVHQWEKESLNKQVLRLTFSALPRLIDPRLVNTDFSATIYNMLFDGLFRYGKDGKIQPSIAESYEIKEDKKVYIFKLRDSLFTNKEPVTAFDFEYTWKKVLSPDFFSPLSHLFYPIKNAKLAKEGIVGVEQIGVCALDDKTLRVELEFPLSKFIEYLAHPLFSPIDRKNDVIHPNWCSEDGENYICNGPFKIVKSKTGESLELIKNTLYWDKEAVQIEKILITKAAPRTALQKFRKDNSDWLGRPVQLWNHVFLETKEKAITGTVLGKYLLVFNTSKFPFNNKNFRKALGLAINRKAMREAYPEFIRPVSSLCFNNLSHQDDYLPVTSEAQKLLEQAFKELSLSKRSLPTFSILQSNGEVQEGIAKILQKTWLDTLGISVNAEGVSWQTLKERLYKGNYYIAAFFMPEIALDPLFALYPYLNRHDRMNMCWWEHPQFKELLSKAFSTDDEEKREAMLKSAEKLLREEAPVVPLFQEMSFYIKNSKLAGANMTKAGALDLKWAYFNVENDQDKDTYLEEVVEESPLLEEPLCL